MKNAENVKPEYLSKEEKENLIEVGYDVEEKEREGSFIQQDDRILFFTGLRKGVEIIPIDEAIEKYPEVKSKYYGKAFRKLGEDFEKDTKGGYFIRVKKGVKVAFPVQVCLLLKKEGFRQKVHNLIIVEENASLYLITGCASSKSAYESYHLGISEFYVHKNGFLNFTMVHSWRKDIEVEPKSVSVVEEGGVFLSNYISLKPVKRIKMYPACILEGANSSARFNSIILGHEGSFQDIGARVILKNRKTSAEIVSRAVSLGGEMVVRGDIVAESSDVKAHIECRGLMVKEKGKIHAVPELESFYRDVELTHEAAIGKIKREEIEYLASRGIPEDEAQSIIIRGFIDVEILGLPPVLKDEIKKVMERSVSGGM